MISADQTAPSLQLPDENEYDLLLRLTLLDRAIDGFPKLPRNAQNRHITLSDFYFLVRTRIARNPGGSVLNAKRAEPADFDPVAEGQARFHLLFPHGGAATVGICIAAPR